MLFLWGCASDKSSLIEDVHMNINTKAGESIMIDYDEFIDIDYTSANLSEDERLLIYEAYSRFYSNVREKDSQLICGIEEGSVINISEKLFNHFLKDMDMQNSSGIIIADPIDYSQSILHLILSERE